MNVKNSVVVRAARQCLAIASVLVIATVGNADGSTEQFIVFDQCDCLGTAMEVVGSMSIAENYAGVRSIKRVGSAKCWNLA